MVHLSYQMVVTRKGAREKAPLFRSALLPTHSYVISLAFPRSTGQAKIVPVCPIGDFLGHICHRWPTTERNQMFHAPILKDKIEHIGLHGCIKNLGVGIRSEGFYQQVWT